jgi:hypothetical protein
MSFYFFFCHQITLLESAEAESAFFQLLAEKINIALYMPGDSITSTGDLISSLFYVYKGEILGLIISKLNANVDARHN